MKVLTAEQTKILEKQAADNGLSYERLMENAGAAATRFIKDNFDIYNSNIVVVTGQGNNGGDGYVIARKLKEYGVKVSVVAAMAISVTAESSAMHTRALNTGVATVYYYDNKEFADELLFSADIIIDAVFGTGFHGVADKDTAYIFEQINASKAKIISLDLPSGVGCNDGSVHGLCIKADFTVSFIGYKPCHFLFPATEYCGKVIPVSIGIEVPENINCFAEVISLKNSLDSIFKIPKNANKGTKGTTTIFAGSYGMAGAACFAAKSAMRSGAGIVRLCVPDSIYGIVSTLSPEAVFKPLRHINGFLCAQSFEKDLLNGAKSVLIGPGIGKNQHTAAVVNAVLENTEVPTVIDADALNILSENLNWLLNKKATFILTPHPGEMSRLTGLSIEKIEKDRISVAKDFAVKYGVILVLKGAYTVVASPNGKVFLNVTGNEGMATAGSGDMLSGIISAFLANGTEPLKAVTAGVCLHGRAGELTACDLGVRGMTVSDMIDRLPLVFK